MFTFLSSDTTNINAETQTSELRSKSCWYVGIWFAKIGFTVNAIVSLSIFSLFRLNQNCGHLVTISMKEYQVVY